VLHHEVAADQNPFAVQAGLTSSAGGACVEWVQQLCTGCEYLGLSDCSVSHKAGFSDRPTPLKADRKPSCRVAPSAAVLLASNSSSQFPATPLWKYGSVHRPWPASTSAYFRLP